MVIPEKSEVQNCHIELFFTAKIMMINQFVFECVKIAFHQSVVVRVASTAHTLRNTVNSFDVNCEPWSLCRIIPLAVA